MIAYKIQALDNQYKDKNKEKSNEIPCEITAKYLVKSQLVLNIWLLSINIIINRGN